MGTWARPVHSIPQRKASLTLGLPPGGPGPLMHLTSPSRTPSPPTPGALRSTRPLRNGACVVPAGLPSAQPAAPPRQHVPGEPRPAPGRRSVSFLKMLLGFFWVTCCVRRAPLPRAGDAQFLKCPGRHPPLPPFPALVSPLLHPPFPRASPPPGLSSPAPGCSFASVQVGPGIGLVLRCVALLPPPFLMAGFSWDCSLSLQVDLAFKEPKTFSVRDIGDSPPGTLP